MKRIWVLGYWHYNLMGRVQVTNVFFKNLWSEPLKQYIARDVYKQTTSNSTLPLLPWAPTTSQALFIPDLV